jgi:hypothetical protein
VPRFEEDEQGFLCYKGRICVPADSELKEVIMKEAHETPYSIHPGGPKMYQDFKEQFWWHGMKREIASYISKCDICQRVKAEHQRPTGLLQPLKSQNGSGNLLEWISSPDFQSLVEEMTLFGSLWID